MEREQDKDIEIFDGTSEHESPLLNVSLQILGVIMEYSFGVEYIKFRATCKHCYIAAPLMRCQLYSPWFMVLDNYRGIITFIDPLCGEKYYIKTPRELKGDCHIFCSRYGWLLMSEVYGRKLVFFNPFTSNIHKLPALPSVQILGFSAPPTSPDCMVVGFTPNHVFIHFVSQEAPSWRSYRLDFGGSNPYPFHILTFSGRDVYASCKNKRIHVLRDIGKEDYSWEVVKDKALGRYLRTETQYFLSKCNQHLLLVLVDKFGESVEVFKLNDSTKEWEKMDSLGKHMIYISGTSCVCLEAKSLQMGNKVYFPRLLHNDDTKIVFYSLETRKFHTFDDKYIQKISGVDFVSTKSYIYPHTWIEPSWS